MILHAKPTPHEADWHSRGRVTIGRPAPDKPKEEEEKEFEFFSKEEFKV